LFRSRQVLVESIACGCNRGVFLIQRIFSGLPLGFELRTAKMAFLVWKEMDADLPETRDANWLTEPLGPPPDPSPFGRTASAAGLFANTYHSRRLMRPFFFNSVSLM
jgi:hypothetical protein